MRKLCRTYGGVLGAPGQIPSSSDGGLNEKREHKDKPQLDREWGTHLGGSRAAGLG